MATIEQTISGKTLAEWVDWLKTEGCGCCHLPVGFVEKGVLCICVGWHNYDGAGDWRVAWKIGIDGWKNGMQTDLDIDFPMPYDAESGDVYDTEETIEGDDIDWTALAVRINETAQEVYDWQLQYDYAHGENDNAA